MKKLLVLVFVVSSLVACGKKQPAAKAPTATPDSKMEGAGTEMKKEDAKPTEGAAKDAKPTPDPCAPPK